MAIANANMSYDGNGPSASGQVIAQSGLQGNAAQMFIGTATFTGDGASKTAVLNYIDGTATLLQSPSLILANTIGGTDTGNAAGGPASVAAVVDNADKKGATVQFATAPGNTKTVQIAFMLVK